MPSTDPRLNDLRELHQRYAHGDLRILVGNGISIGCGFPSWDELNRGLLRNLVESDARDQNVWTSLLFPELPDLCTKLYDVLSRDGSAEFVKSAAPARFLKTLAAVLYRSVDIELASPGGVHFQLASMSSNAQIATTNFDPLLEIAVAISKGDRSKWRRHRIAAQPSARFRPGLVEHIHGWIDPDGKVGGELVLTEADYFELARTNANPANLRLRKLFTSRGAVLILGMSMADINIRRLLYLISKRPLRGDSTVYIVLRQRDPLTDQYTQEYWYERRVKLIFYQEHEELPGLLRDIQWGTPDAGRYPAWATQSISNRALLVPDSMMFDDDWQQIAFSALTGLITRMRIMFAVPAHEVCHASLFVPMNTNGAPRLRLMANSRRVRTGAEARRFSLDRNLSFRSGNEQGLAGIAFARGLERESLHGDRGLDFNFTDSMRTAWLNEDGYRDWRSVLAVPVMQNPGWIPGSAITLTSNLAKPFWTRFEDREVFRQELLVWVRETAMWLLGGFLG